MKRVGRLIPRLSRSSAQLYKLARGLRYRGNNRFCPLCGVGSSRFFAFGNPPRADSRCIHCGSMERHRLAWLYLENHSDLFDGGVKRTLHFAPEPMLQRKLQRRLGSGYMTADLYQDHVMENIDITDINFPNGTFDVILCSHVLEHVPDDGKAISELYRVLKSGGWTLVMVPIKGQVTDEDLSIVDAHERLIRFGQEDHVRQYGMDVVDRLSNAGFEVEVVRAMDFLDDDAIVRYGLSQFEEEIFICRCGNA